MKGKIASVALAALFALALAAQSAELARGGSAPVVDGVSGASEYPGIPLMVAGMEIWAHRAADGTMTMALRAPAKGWIAVGFGTAVMDGSVIVIGFVKDGKAEYRIDKGAGKSHSPGGSIRILDLKLAETADSTVMELSFDPAPFVKNGKLDFIVAYGAADNYVAKHVKRGAASYVLK